MPSVKPSITDQGTESMNFPSRKRDIKIIKVPAIRPIKKSEASPYFATSGTRTTVIAPVGPLTW